MLELHTFWCESLQALDVEVAKRYHAVPVALRDGILVVAIGDPMDMETADALSFVLNRDIEYVCATPDSIKKSIADFYGTEAESGANGAGDMMLRAEVGDEETTAGDPMSPVKWTSKSTRTIAEELGRSGHPVSNVTVARCLQEMGYTLQANVKTREGPQHLDRDAQFRYINDQVKQFRAAGQPAVSVDTKKKGSSAASVGRLRLVRAAAGTGRRGPAWPAR